MKKIFLLGLFLTVLFSPLPSYAAINTLSMQNLTDGILSTVIYGLVGIVMASLGYKVVDLLTPGNLSKDIVEGQNKALATLAASMILGICIIIAAVLVG